MPVTDTLGNAQPDKTVRCPELVGTFVDAVKSTYAPEEGSKLTAKDGKLDPKTGACSLTATFTNKDNTAGTRYDLQTTPSADAEKGNVGFRISEIDAGGKVKKQLSAVYPVEDGIINYLDGRGTAKEGIAGKQVAMEANDAALLGKAESGVLAKVVPATNARVTPSATPAARPFVNP